MLWMDDVEDVVDARYSLFNELNAELVRPPTSVARPPVSARMTWCRLGLRR
jgi:hypothetical protein